MDTGAAVGLRAEAELIIFSPHAGTEAEGGFADAENALGCSFNCFTMGIFHKVAS